MESENGARAKAANPDASGASLLPPVKGGWFRAEGGNSNHRMVHGSGQAPAPLLTKDDHGGLQNHRARPRRVNRHAARFPNGLFQQPRPGSGSAAATRAEA